MKLFFGVNEAAKIVGVKPHTLRYWESKISALRPQRRKSRRFYSIEDLRVALVVRYLIKEQGYSLIGASRKIEREGVEKLFPRSWESLSLEIKRDLEYMRKEAKRLGELLEKPPHHTVRIKKKRS